MSPQIHKHNISTNAPIYSFLKSYSPYSLPIYRRLQYEILRTRNNDSDAEKGVLLASFSPGDVPSPMSWDGSGGCLKCGEPFVVLFLDLRMLPGPTGYLFTSLDVLGSWAGFGEGGVGGADGELEGLEGRYQRSHEHRHEHRHKDEHKDEHELGVLQSILFLLRYINQYRDPYRDPSSRISNGRQDQDKIIKLSSTAASTAFLLRNHLPSILRDDIRGPGGPYRKYIFHPSARLPLFSSSTNTLSFSPSPSPSPTELGLNPSEIEEKDFERIMQTNSLVGSRDLLREMIGFAFREEKMGKVAAWAFWGSDGGVRTVFCEEEWRRKGLAREVVKGLVGKVGSELEGEQVYGSEGVAEVEREGKDGGGAGGFWVHADIAADNEGSIRLFEGLGGKFGWEAYWMRADLGRLPDSL